MLEDSPWRIGNTNADLIKTKKDTQKYWLDIYQKELIEEDANQFKEGLTLTFQTLHEAIATRDTATISAICEGNLRTAINDFFDALDEEECEIQER